MVEQLKKIAFRAFHFFSDPAHKHWVKWIDRSMNVFLLGLLAWQIQEIPITDMLASLPVSPFFYLVWLFLFFLVPVSEYHVYQYKWKFSGLQVLKGFLLKKIYNNELYNYTGELFFINWISNYLNISKTEAALFIKDNNLISSLVSSVLAFAIIGVQLYLGLFNLSDIVDLSNNIVNVAVVAIAIAVVLILYRFRDNLINSDRKLMWKLIWGYSFRFVFRQAVLVLMWYFAAPHVPMSIWLNFLFIRILLDRLPVGNRSLIFLTMAPWLSSSFEIGIETFTGIQIAVTLLDKGMSGIMLIWAKRQGEPA